MHSWLRSVGLCSSNRKSYATGCNPGHFLLSIPTMFPQELQPMDYVTGAACLVPHAEVTIFSVSSCRTADTTTTPAASPSLLTYFLRRGDQNWQHWKQVGTPMFHKASQSFYTQEQATSNPSCPVLSSPPDAVWPTVDVFGCQSLSSQYIQSKSKISLLSCNCQLWAPQPASRV